MELSIDFEDNPVIKIEPDIGNYNFDGNSNESEVFDSESFLNHTSDDVLFNEGAILMPELPELMPLGSQFISDMPELIPMSTQPDEPKENQCDFCSKIFKRKSHLTRHRLLHTGEKPYACTLCDERFTRSENRTRHIAQVHQQNFRYACQICGKGFSLLQRKQIHMQVHFQERLIFCPFCGNSYTSNSSLTNHMKTHESAASVNGAVTRVYHECTDCGKKFTRKDHMLRHKNSHTGLRPFQCDICLKSFSRKDNLVKHRVNCASKHVPLKPWSLQGDESDPLHIGSVSYEQLPATELPESDFPQPEEQCDAESILPIDSFERNEFPISVPNSKDGSVEIFLVKKKKEKEIEVPTVTEINESLRRRKRKSKLPQLTPEEELTLNCGICNKKLSQKPYLQRHKLSHLLVRPYQCDLCSKSFTRNEHLKRHKFSHACPLSMKPELGEANADIWKNKLEFNKNLMNGTSFADSMKHKFIESSFNENSLNENSLNENSFDGSIIKSELPYLNEYEDFNDEKNDEIPEDYYDNADNYLNSFLEVSMTTTSLDTRERVSIKDDLDDVSEVGSKNRQSKKIFPDLKPQSETTNGTNGYQCDKCNKSYPKPYLLARHYTIHTGEKRYKCEICDRGFTRLEHQKRHMAIHSQQRKYECEICTKRFSRADHMLSHIKNYHVDVKPYKCTFSCGQRFDTLKEKLAHTQLRNCIHRCLICKTNFNAKEQLLYHNLVAHSNGECSLIPNAPKETGKTEPLQNESVNNTLLDDIKIEYEDPLSMGDCNND